MHAHMSVARDLCGTSEYYSLCSLSSRDLVVRKYPVYQLYVTAAAEELHK